MRLKNYYFLLRHGETVYQIKKRDFVYPWPDKPPVKLTKNGETEIKRLTKTLKKDPPLLKLRRARKIDIIYSSDIFRARKTARVVAEELGIKKINLDKRLRDINLGVYHGKTKAEFYRDFSDLKKRFQKGPKNGESWDDVKKRVANFIKDIDKKYKNKNILVVSHGDPLWLLEGAVNDSTNQELLDEIFVKKNYIKVSELRQL